MVDDELQLWTELYRPKTFSDIKGQEKIVERVKAFVKSKNLPHMLFSGPAGVGKTTLALITAQELYGEHWRQNILDLNASDERGIDVVRVKVKDFARTKAMGTDLPKIVYLDESDSLTKEAQQALRRTMENFSRTARFILSCNFSSKIIDPIQSRCTVFRFKPLDRRDMAKIIEQIGKDQGLHVDQKAIDALCDLSEGDVRRAVNMLQGCAAVDKKITESLLYEIVSAAQPKEVKDVLETALRGDFHKARHKLLDVMLQHGLSGLDIIRQIQKEIWGLSIRDENKVKLIERCGEIEFRMVEGSDEFIQLEALLATFTIINK